MQESLHFRESGVILLSIFSDEREHAVRRRFTESGEKVEAPQQEPDTYHPRTEGGS